MVEGCSLLSSTNFSNLSAVFPVKTGMGRIAIAIIIEYYQGAKIHIISEAAKETGEKEGHGQVPDSFLCVNFRSWPCLNIY